MSTYNNTARVGTKRHTAAVVMTENGDRPMNDVLPLIAAAIGVTEGNARGYYIWLVENKFAPGQAPEKRTRSVKAPVAPEATVAALAAEMTPSDGEIEAAKRGEEVVVAAEEAEYDDLRKEIAAENATAV